MFRTGFSNPSKYFGFNVGNQMNPEFLLHPHSKKMFLVVYHHRYIRLQQALQRSCKQLHQGNFLKR
jgi:hypothetical protein